MMKIFVTLAVGWAFSAFLVEGFNKEAAFAMFRSKVEECKSQVGATDSDVHELMQKTPSSTMEGKCLRSCIMKQFEVMDENGKFAKDVALVHAEKHTNGSEEKMKIAKEIIDKCGAIDVSDDHCEAAEQYGKCLKDEGQRFKNNFQL